LVRKRDFGPVGGGIFYPIGKTRGRNDVCWAGPLGIPTVSPYSLDSRPGKIGHTGITGFFTPLETPFYGEIFPENFFKEMGPVGHYIFYNTGGFGAPPGGNWNFSLLERPGKKGGILNLFGREALFQFPKFFF